MLGRRNKLVDFFLIHKSSAIRGMILVYQIRSLNMAYQEQSVFHLKDNFRILKKIYDLQVRLTNGHDGSATSYLVSQLFKSSNVPASFTIFQSLVQLW